MKALAPNQITPHWDYILSFKPFFGKLEEKRVVYGWQIHQLLTAPDIQEFCNSSGVPIPSYWDGVKLFAKDHSGFFLFRKATKDADGWFIFN